MGFPCLARWGDTRQSQRSIPAKRWERRSTRACCNFAPFDPSETETHLLTPLSKRFFVNILLENDKVAGPGQRRVDVLREACVERCGFVPGLRWDYDAVRWSGFYLPAEPVAACCWAGSLWPARRSRVANVTSGCGNQRQAPCEAPRTLRLPRYLRRQPRRI